jgi:hypothetical protein
VTGAGLLVLASLIVNTTVTVMATYFQGWLPIPATVLQIVNVTMSFGLMTTVFTLCGFRKFWPLVSGNSGHLVILI